MFRLYLGQTAFVKRGLNICSSITWTSPFQITLDQLFHLAALGSFVPDLLGPADSCFTWIIYYSCAWTMLFLFYRNNFLKLYLDQPVLVLPGSSTTAVFGTSYSCFTWTICSSCTCTSLFLLYLHHLFQLYLEQSLRLYLRVEQ